MRPLRQVGARVRLLRAPRASPRPAAALSITAKGPSTRSALNFAASRRFLHAERADEPIATLPDVAAASTAPETPPRVAEESNSALLRRIDDSDSSYHEALQAFNELRSRGMKLFDTGYLSLLYKASREGRYEQVWSGYEEFMEDDKRGEVNGVTRAVTTWTTLTTPRMQMHRFVLWAMLDSQREQAMAPFYQSEVVGKANVLGVHEADALNFLLAMECTTKMKDEQDLALRQRAETLLSVIDGLELHTSYSSSHAFFRVILRRPEIFFEELAGVEENAEHSADDGEPTQDATYSAEDIGTLIIEYMERFPCALGVDPKRLSLAVSAAAAAGHHGAAKLLLEYGAKHHVPVDAGSFAHTVESAPDDASRLMIADLYMHAKQNELIYTTQDTDSSIANYLLLHAVWDGNFKHMMELLHEMQLYNNKMTNRAVGVLFKSIAQYRADIRHGPTDSDTSNPDKKLVKCPTIMELFTRFPNAIPHTIHSFSQGILQSLYAGDLPVALEIMRAALWSKDITLRPEIYSQLLYPLLAGGQRGGDESSDASVFDRLEVERCFDRQHPGKRTYLNSLIVNICQSNDDFSTMLVCLDRWQGQGHPPMSRRVIKRVFEVISKQIQKLQQEDDEVTPGTAFVVDGMQLSYLAFMVRYRKIVAWDAWTIERAIVRARTSGLQADVVALLAEADARSLVLNSAAYIVSLCVLEEVGEPSAVVACAERMKTNNVWEKAVNKDPEAREILSRALAKLEEVVSTTD